MPDRILFYVSGHGYGHARRMSLVIEALAAQASDVEVVVRSAAPWRIFERVVPAHRIEPTAIDAGMAERGPLEIDAQGTLQRLVDLVDRSDAVVAEEVEAVRRIGPGLIVADIPFLAGDVAEAAGVPCVGISNFTWDWICDPLLAGDGRYPAVRRRMVDGYAKMRAVLQLPFGDVSEGFRQRIPVRLIAGHSTRDPADVLRQIGIDARDDRPRVAIGMRRHGVSAEALAAAVAGAADFHFLIPQELPAVRAANATPVRLGPDLDFSDLVAVSDMVVSKLGYGIVSDCIAAGKVLLWPRRTGFREDGVVERDGPPVLRMREIDRADFDRGAWRADLLIAQGLPHPPARMPVDGAEACARQLRSELVRE